MKVQIVDAPQSQKEISIEIPYDELEKASEIECERLTKDAKIPGFRPGKAPKDVVKKQNALKIKTHALERVISNAIRDVLIGNNINPIAQPDIQNVVADDGNPITFTAYVDVFPQFDVEKFKGYEFARTKIKVTDEDVNNTIKRLKEEYTEYIPVREKREVRNGDRTIIDFVGKKDGEPFEGGKAKKQTLDIGSGSFIPGFEDGVIGMLPEETKDICLKFPDNYHEDELSGKDVVFTVTLREIQEKT
ncbi:MAG: trigger factor, partial [Deferribacteraceae bacterium]|nr:trigger factor [Deferribacteraceae bacterium]